MSAITMVMQVAGQVRGTAVLDEGASFEALCQQVKECTGVSESVIALEMFYAQGQSKLVKTDAELSQVLGMLQANFVVLEVVCGAQSAEEGNSSGDDAFVFVKMKKALNESSIAEDDSDSDSDSDRSNEEDSDDEDNDAGMVGGQERYSKDKRNRKKELVLMGVEEFKASFQCQEDCLAFLAFAQAKRGRAKKFGLELSKDTPKMGTSEALEREDVLLANFVVIQAPLGLVLKKLGLKPKQLNKVGLNRLAQVFMQWRCGGRHKFGGPHGPHGQQPHHHHAPPPHHHHGPPHHHHHGPPFGPPHHHRHGHHGHHHHHGPPFGPPHHHRHGHHGHHHHHGPPFGPPHHRHGHHGHHHHHGPPFSKPWAWGFGDDGKQEEDASALSDEGEGFTEVPGFGARGMRGRGGMRKRMMMHRMAMHGHGPRGRRGRANKLGGPNKRMARLVRHKTMMDGAKVPVDTPFTKTWVVRNDSESQWPCAAQLVHIGGDDMEGTMTQLVGPLKPGEESEVSITGLKAPPLPGLYKSFFRFQSNKGHRFGQRLWCSILAE